MKRYDHVHSPCVGKLVISALSKICERVGAYIRLPSCSLVCSDSRPCRRHQMAFSTLYEVKVEIAVLMRDMTNALCISAMFENHLLRFSEGTLGCG